jgi:hypothetical protein
MRRFLSLSLALWLMWAWADAPAWISRAETITPTDLRAHLEFIASDELEGRDTPSRGLDLAGMYIVSHLQRWGVKPAGENGTYYQTLRFRTDSLNPAESRIRISGQSFEYGVGFVARPVALNATAPLVYVGNGWSNPDKGIDPYAGLEVAGKVLVVQAGYPKEVIEQGLDAAPTAGWRSPEQNAEAKGALAILRIDPSDMERIERIARAWSQRRVVEGLQPVSSIPVIVASAPMLNALFAGEQVAAAELIRRANDNDPAPSFALSPSKQMSITLSVQTRVEAARSVIGAIEGSDPVLKREYVSIGAHLDHVGVAARGEDRIFNGADDNGSGSVALLEIAEAFATGPRPRRSILLLWYAGEEQGTARLAPVRGATDCAAGEHRREPQHGHGGAQQATRRHEPAQPRPVGTERGLCDWTQHRQPRHRRGTQARERPVPADGAEPHVRLAEPPRTALFPQRPIQLRQQGHPCGLLLHGVARGLPPSDGLGGED